MLILSRKLKERIVMGDGKIVLQVVRIDKDSVKLGIEAPMNVPVHREEIEAAIREGKKAKS